jgi:hypothetical protein
MTSNFAPKPGCPMCSIVSTALHAPSNSPRSPSFPVGSTQPEILWRDDHFTAYREKANPVSSKGHIVIAFKFVSTLSLPLSLLTCFAACMCPLYIPSSVHLFFRPRLAPTVLKFHPQSSSDLPLLVNIRNLARRVLASLLPPSSPASPGQPINPQDPHSQFHIGFITPPFKDNKIPVTDHLHAHAYIAPADLMGWWRGIAYSGLAWYDIDDLIAEIRSVFLFFSSPLLPHLILRETVSNNRVKSGYESRTSAPIDSVPGAGARTGTADGVEVTEPSLAGPDLEDGVSSPGAPPLTLVHPQPQRLLSPPPGTGNIPHLRV